MAASNPAMIVRVAATIEELKKNLAEGKSQIETTTAAMQKMASSFSGERLIQAANNVAAAVQSIGGASKLTGAEQDRVNSLLERALEKYRALGREAPAGMQQLADATKRVTTASEGWSEMLSKATSVLSALGIGVSIGALVSFGRELLANADALMKLHDMTGVSIEGLQRFQIAADDAGNTIEDITGAIVKMEDKLVSGDKSAIGALEKLGLELVDLRSLSPENQFIAISDAIRQIEDPAEQVNIAIDLFGKQGANVLPTLKRGFDDLKDSVAIASAETVKFWDDFGDRAAKASRSLKGETMEALEFLFGGWSRGQREAEAFGKQIEGLKGPVADVAEAFKVLGMTEGDVATADRELTASAKESIAVHEKMAAAMAELNSVGKDLHATVDEISGSVVEAIKFYLDAGVAQGTLATAYGLTDTQVKAIARSLQEEKAAQQEAAATTAAHAKAAQDAAAALEAEAEASAKAKKAVQEKAAADKKAAEEKAAANRAMGNTLDVAHAVRADPELAQLLAQGWSLENAEQILLAKRWNFVPKLYSPKGQPETSPDPSERVPGYASGVMNAPGGWALVGERGPEIMRVPRGADIYPSGSGGGATFHMPIYITHPLGTPQAIAAAVDQAVMQRLRDLGVRF